MKRLLFSTITVLAVALAASCSKDGEMLTASLPGEDGIDIGSADGEIVLEMDHASALALTLYWNELGDLVLSNPDAQVPEDAVSNTLQFAAEDTFAEPYEDPVATGAVSAQYTVSALNSIVSRLGFEGGVAATLYIRMKTMLGENTEPRYGAALQFTVTPYHIDMTRVTVRSKNDGTDVATIPALSDGEYAGLMTVPSSWLNFYFVEGDGTTWGTLNDGTSGTAFALQRTTDLTSWNNWFPEPSGCYYVTMSTSAAEWTATSLPVLRLQVGDAGQEMTYHKAQNMWSCVITTQTDAAAVDLVQDGQLYNQTTGDSAPVAQTLSLVAADDGSFSVTEGTVPSGISAGAAGTYTLLLDVTAQHWKLAEGEVEVGGGDDDTWPADPDYAVPTSESVYIYNLDGNNSPTTVAGTLAAAGEGLYEGFFYFAAWYNFKIGDSSDPASARIYGSAPTSDDGALYRLYSGDDMYNFWYDSAVGAYCYVTVDFANRTWSCEPVSSLEVVGSFNGYTLGSNELAFDAATRTWSATVGAESWGSGFYLIVNDDWNRCYTDPDLDGRLEFRSSSTGSEFLPAILEDGGSYLLTVDLNDPSNLTYTLTEAGGESDPDPVYAEHLYVHYCWKTKYAEELAATLCSEQGNGVYSGYVSTSGSWDDELYTNFVFSDSATPNEGTVYGTLPGSQFTLDSSEGSYAGWFSTLGLNRVTVDLASGSWSEEPLAIAVTGTFNSWSLSANAMAFDLETKTWQATCDVAEIGDGLQIVLGDSWNYVYGGSDGVLVTADNNNNILPETTGRYLVTVDLRDAGNLTYTLTKLE
ncbi:DUF5114 domain-containing protein [uncultured Alistipes sp.]|uniref:DUF5114 domain-containing protein n=1 Tax=uncultured Alistipes sp. TaxID=538949 RepID=UPI00262E7066|nr:DUF5114 domain-containing protein [uncultured Alistipes sp.]